MKEVSASSSGPASLKLPHRGPWKGLRAATYIPQPRAAPVG
jgi:hypothetical protein